MTTESRTMTLLGVRIDNLGKQEAIEALKRLICQRRFFGASRVYFANVHTIHLARTSHDFRDVVNSADLVLPDGSGLKIAGRLFGMPVRANLNGTDLSPQLLALAEREGWSVFLFGSEEEVVRRCAGNLWKQFPRLRLAGYHSGYLAGEQEEKRLVDLINERSPDILLVGLGSPRQEEWINKWADHLSAGVCLGIGGLFDFMGGRFRRAPRWIRAIGCEWVYRFLQDPRTKWDRVFVEIPMFLIVALAKALQPRRARGMNG